MRAHTSEKRELERRDLAQLDADGNEEGGGRDTEQTGTEHDPRYSAATRTSSLQLHIQSDPIRVWTAAGPVRPLPSVAGWGRGRIMVQMMIHSRRIR